MFRLIITRVPLSTKRLSLVARPPTFAKVQSVRPTPVSCVRRKSTLPPPETYVDWNGPKLAYEQVKSRAEQPSPVRQDIST